MQAPLSVPNEVLRLKAPLRRNSNFVSRVCPRSNIQQMGFVLIRAQCVGWLAGAALGFCLTPVAYAEPTTSPWAAQMAAGERFLAELYDPALDLLPEYHGARVYWLYHDNYLAAKLLDQSRPDMARHIRASMHQFGGFYSGKVEILFGEATNGFPFHTYQLLDVTNISGKIIRTERVTSHLLKGWDAYGDLLLMAALARSHEDTVEARSYLDKAVRLWDGHGFADPASKKSHLYATYKLALAILAADALQRPLLFKDDLVRQVRRLQSNAGGWITDYDSDGNPHGLSNVETTCMVLLALKKL